MVIKFVAYMRSILSQIDRTAYQKVGYLAQDNENFEHLSHGMGYR